MIQACLLSWNWSTGGGPYLLQESRNYSGPEHWEASADMEEPEKELLQALSGIQPCRPVTPREQSHFAKSVRRLELCPAVLEGSPSSPMYRSLRVDTSD